MTFDGNNHIMWGEAWSFYDPYTEVEVGMWLRQTRVHRDGRDQYTIQCYSRVSEDPWRTWSEPQLIRYEESADFDPSNPYAPAFIENNQVYPGNNMIRHSNGTLIFAGTSIRIPADAPDPDPEKKYVGAADYGPRNIGSACFVGRLDKAGRRIDWRRGACVWVPQSVSCRGLSEAEVAELKNGRVIVAWRGSNTKETPGRKWYSVSDDGGMTLSHVQDFRYDDGTQFYSPASYHRFIRHRVTGKLYWVGNICKDPPHGNHPRFPLVIAEVNEDIPALKRKTVAIIEDRRSGETDMLTRSNFSLFENRETHELELYLTPIGAKGRFQNQPCPYWEADCFKYTISVK